MRALILVAGAALALGACGRSDNEQVDTNALTGDNMMMTDNATDAGMTGAGGLDANAATNSATEANMVAKDLTSNDADTNLANGM